MDVAGRVRLRQDRECLPVQRHWVLHPTVDREPPELEVDLRLRAEVERFALGEITLVVRGVGRALTDAVLAGLVLLAAYALLSNPAFQMQRAGALGIATLFAVHPITSECVYPVASGRETLLPALFILIATISHLRPGRTWQWLSVVAFLFALFCKEQAIVVPALFLAADWLGLTPRRLDRVSAFGPYIAMLIAIAIPTFMGARRRAQVACGGCASSASRP